MKQNKLQYTYRYGFPQQIAAFIADSIVGLSAKDWWRSRWWQCIGKGWWGRGWEVDQRQKVVGAPRWTKQSHGGDSEAGVHVYGWWRFGGGVGEISRVKGPHGWHGTRYTIAARILVFGHGCFVMKLAKLVKFHVREDHLSSALVTDCTLHLSLHEPLHQPKVTHRITALTLPILDGILMEHLLKEVT